MSHQPVLLDPEDRQARASQALEARSGDPLFAFGEDLRVVWWNDASAELTGIPAASALGRPCWQVVGALDTRGNVVCHKGCSSARLAGEGWPVRCRELLVRTAGRRRRRMFVSTIAIREEGKTLFLHLLHERRVVSPTDAPSLTPRQHDVLRLLAEGLPPKAVASRLGLKLLTVRNHIRAIRLALDAHSQLEALAKARHFGLLED
jgi:DNA-binding CsgD family transcriptional regulator